MRQQPNHLTQSPASAAILSADKVTQRREKVVREMLVRIKPAMKMYLDHSTSLPDLTGIVKNQIGAMTEAVTHLSDDVETNAAQARYEAMQLGGEQGLKDRLIKLRNRMTTFRPMQVTADPLVDHRAIIEQFKELVDALFKQATASMKRLQSARRRSRGELLTLQASKAVVGFFILTLGFGRLQDLSGNLGWWLGASVGRTEWWLRPASIQVCVYLLVAVYLFALDRLVLSPAIEWLVDRRTLAAREDSLKEYCENRIRLEYAVALLEHETDKAGAAPALTAQPDS